MHLYRTLSVTWQVSLWSILYIEILSSKERFPPWCSDELTVLLSPILQDQFDNLEKHTQWGIEYLEKYTKFVKERSEIELNYAKQIRWALERGVQTGVHPRRSDAWPQWSVLEGRREICTSSLAAEPDLWPPTWGKAEIRVLILDISNYPYLWISLNQKTQEPLKHTCRPEEDV